MRKLFSLTLALTAAIPMMAADAHGIWFAQRAKQLAIVYGIGADDLDTAKRFPLLEKIVAYDSAYQPITATARIAGPIVLVDADEPPTLVTAVMQNGIWSRRKGEDFEKKGRDEMPDAVLATNNIKYAVTIQGALSAPIPALPDHDLQIVPASPIPDLLGKPLTYRVLYKGKPLANARMINDMVNDPDAKEQMTDAKGEITMPVRNQGLNVIRAVYDGPTDNAKKYDRIEYTATLSFTLAHLPE